MKFNGLHYDDIPDRLMQGEKTILELGASNGLSQHICRHREFFIANNNAGRYHGIDIRDFQHCYLNIVRGDIRTYEPEQKYDLVLALHVLEHIDLSYWESVISRLLSAVAPRGFLVIGVPNREPEVNHPYTDHRVFNITSDMMRRYLPDAIISTLPNPFPFANDGVSFGWALLRYLKRRLVRDPAIRRYNRMLAIWRNQP